ncbi:response regulator [Reichenbachiella versicolor]|uniref:response regulator n=1 Tax=Reichenbachiella versicolor TaxID=1821036 RepID=UPI000D6E0077|nr:response regulator transcription factor [Reichenbachiella versicolor]
MIKALIVDDHALFSQGMKTMFEPEDGIAVTCETKNGYEIPSILEKKEVDVIIMDIDMPMIDGLAALDLLKREKIDIPVLMLTMHQSINRIRGALERGAQGYILKDASKDELVEAITSVSQRKNYFHPKIHEEVFDYFKGKTSAKNKLQELSKREIEIIRCLADGMNTKRMAESLFISEHTIRTHRRNIMQKLHVKTSAELVKLAIDRELI